MRTARRLENEALVALTIVGDEIVFGTDTGDSNLAVHLLNDSDPKLAGLIEQVTRSLYSQALSACPRWPTPIRPKPSWPTRCPGQMADTISILSPDEERLRNRPQPSVKAIETFTVVRRLSSAVHTLCYTRA